MKKLFPVLACVLTVCMLLASALCPAFAEEGAPAPVPTLEPGPNDFIYDEASGGEFRPLPIDQTGGAKLPSKAKYNAKVSIYQDPTIRVEKHRDYSKEYRGDYAYILIEIRDPSQIRTASADDTWRTSSQMRADVIAKRKNAVVAINGDYCAAFSGNKANNYIFRQGELFRDTVAPELDMLLIDEDGDLHVITSDNDLASVDKTQIDGKKVINILQFGPALVIDGEKVADEILTDPKRATGYVYADSHAVQRMVIGQIDHLHYIVLCTWNPGMSLLQVRDLAMSIAPCKVLYNLDGGNSAQMVFLGKKINNIRAGQTTADIRPITDIIYFASAWFYPDSKK